MRGNGENSAEAVGSRQSKQELEGGIFWKRPPTRRTQERPEETCIAGKEGENVDANRHRDGACGNDVQWEERGLFWARPTTERVVDLHQLDSGRRHCHSNLERQRPPAIPGQGFNQAGVFINRPPTPEKKE